MFLNNPASTRSILANNENATAISRRSKSIGAENNGTTKKAAFKENSMNVKTPHRNKMDASSSKSGQTTQRRRRALGDISNRKGGGGGLGGGGKGGLVLKKQQSSSTQGTLKSGNSKVLFPSSNAKSSRNSQVKFSKTPSAKSTASNKVRLGGGGNAMKASKPKQRSSSSEYDGIFGATTRWSAANNMEDDNRNPFDIVPGDELDMCDNFREEMWEKRRREKEGKDRKELERSEEQFMDSVREVEEANKKDIEELGTNIGRCGISDDNNDEWDLLNQKLPWEEEDGIYDPTEERRLSRTDPYSLWGDI